MLALAGSQDDLRARLARTVVGWTARTAARDRRGPRGDRRHARPAARGAAPQPGPDDRGGPGARARGPLREHRPRLLERARHPHRPAPRRRGRDRGGLRLRPRRREVPPPQGAPGRRLARRGRAGRDRQGAARPRRRRPGGRAARTWSGSSPTSAPSACPPWWRSTSSATTTRPTSRGCARSPRPRAPPPRRSRRFADGGAGGEALGRAVLDLLEAAGDPAPHALYPSDAPFEGKVAALATTLYGAGEVRLHRGRRAPSSRPSPPPATATCRRASRRPRSRSPTTPKAASSRDGHTLTISEVRLAGRRRLPGGAGRAASSRCPGCRATRQPATCGCEPDGSVRGLMQGG